MKKRFSCGHFGKGSYCHRCKQESEKVEEVKPVKIKEFYDPRIDVSLPKGAAKKANKLLKEIDKATNYRQVKANKLKIDSNLVYIRLNKKYRMILERIGKKLSFVKIVDHGTFDQETSGARMKRT